MIENTMRPGLMLSLCLAALATAPSRAADEPPAAPNPITVRVLGLFCPEREPALRHVFQQIPGTTLTSLDYETAEAVVTYDRPLLFPQSNLKQVLKPEQLLQRLNDVVRQTSSGTFSIMPPSTTPKDQLAQVEISVGILDCLGCCLGVHDILTKVDGVQRVTVMKKTGQVTLWIDPAKTNREALEAVLKKANVTVLPKS